MEDPVVKGLPERTGVRSAHDLLTVRRGGLGEVPDTPSDEPAWRIHSSLQAPVGDLAAGMVAEARIRGVFDHAHGTQ